MYRILLALTWLIAADLRAETTWFVVAEERAPGTGQSYLLPLTDPDDIAAARELVEQGPVNGKIAVALVAVGSDGFNRDVNADGTPLWNWHVKQFLEFADFTIELCDGSPQLLADDPRGFTENTQGQICFWGYRVVAELESAPVFQINENLDGAWYNPETAGQGMLLDVLAESLADTAAESGQLFLAWFTYDDAAAKIGAAEHRWFTAQGSYSGDRAELDLTLTTGGIFNDPAPVEHATIGSVSITFTDCNHATVSYAMDSGHADVIELQRLMPLNSCGQ